jgi:hypothetical protein
MESHRAKRADVLKDAKRYPDGFEYNGAEAEAARTTPLPFGSDDRERLSA